MAINRRRKGAHFEREAAKLLTASGITARRTAQTKGCADSFDVMTLDPSCPISLWEVKGGYDKPSSLDPFAVVARAREEAKGKPCALLWKRSRKRWLFVADAEDVLPMLARLKGLEAHAQIRRLFHGEAGCG